MTRMWSNFSAKSPLLDSSCLKSFSAKLCGSRSMSIAVKLITSRFWPLFDFFAIRFIIFFFLRLFFAPFWPVWKRTIMSRAVGILSSFFSRCRRSSGSSSSSESWSSDFWSLPRKKFNARDWIWNYNFTLRRRFFSTKVKKRINRSFKRRADVRRWRHKSSDRFRKWL